METTLGKKLIAELGRRHQLGMYFNYAEYQDLKKVTTSDEMQSFFDGIGYSSICADDDPISIVDALEERDDYLSFRGEWLFMPYIDILLFPFLVFDMLYRWSKERPRMFPQDRHGSPRKLHVSLTDS